MKQKKLWVPAVILAVAIISMIVYGVLSGIAKKPVITEQSFPFSITYELNGKTETIRDIYTASFIGNDGYVDMRERMYTGKIAGMELNDDTFYVLSRDEAGRIELATQFYADYMMGDPRYDYFEGEAFAPRVLYYDSQDVEYEDEETLLKQGVKLIGWDYPEPVENSFVFSHIAPLNGRAVLPMTLMGALALLAVIVLARRDKNLTYKEIDKCSIVCNVAVGALTIPVMIFAQFIDIIGSSSAWDQQMLYLVPALTLLGLTASVALRRQGFGKSALIASWIGPFLLVVVMISDVVL